VAAQQVHHVVCNADANLDDVGVLQHLPDAAKQAKLVQRQQQAHRLQATVE
jgi:hypothetical protein